MFTRVLMGIVSVACVFGDIDEFRSIYETVQIIESNGYVGQAHNLLTTDGYMLEMHRIPFRRNETTGDPDRPVVLLMHGLMAASNSYIALGPDYSISYNLADAGIDVWMGNARGTRNSRRHINYDPNDQEDKMNFFNFTWEQIGYYDVANMIDYILIQTNNTKLHYVGHSQGGTAFLVLNSMRPEYNEKILSAHLLAGVGYKEHFPNVLLRGLAMFTNTIYTLAVRLGIVELFPPILNSSTDYSLRKYEGEDYQVPIGEVFDHDCASDEFCRSADYCTGDVRQKEMCELFGIEEIMSTKILDNIDVDLGIGGAALKQIAHYGQNIQDKTFRRWDYGSMENFLKYGSHLPPAYNISLITVNTTMHYTVNDNLLDERDVLAMCADMPNCVARRIARDSFLHVDFVAAVDVKELVTDYIIEQLWEAHALQPQPEPVGPGTDGSSHNIPRFMATLYLSIVTLFFTL